MDRRIFPVLYKTLVLVRCVTYITPDVMYVTLPFLLLSSIRNHHCSGGSLF